MKTCPYCGSTALIEYVNTEYCTDCNRTVESVPDHYPKNPQEEDAIQWLAYTERMIMEHEHEET